MAGLLERIYTFRRIISPARHGGYGELLTMEDVAWFSLCGFGFGRHDDYGIGRSEKER